MHHQDPPQRLRKLKNLKRSNLTAAAIAAALIMTGCSDDQTEAGLTVQAQDSNPTQIAETTSASTFSSDIANVDDTSQSSSVQSTVEPTQQQDSQTIPSQQPEPTDASSTAPMPTEPKKDQTTTRAELDGAHPDIVEIREVNGRSPGGASWKDSYSVGDKCYCDTTFDHAIGDITVEVDGQQISIRQVCDKIGEGPGPKGRPIYNDIQCGNGPANDAGDEDDCPGRVDIGRPGCGHIGPKWDLSVFQ